MANLTPANGVLEFLRRNKFTNAEAALRSELGKKPDLNGVLESGQELSRKPTEGQNRVNVLEEDRKANYSKCVVENHKNLSSAETSRELIVKEVECGTKQNGSESRWKNRVTIEEHGMVNVGVGTSDKESTFFEGSDDTVVDLYSLKYSLNNSQVHFQNGRGSVNNRNILGYQISGGEGNAKAWEDSTVSGENIMSWPVGTNKAMAELKYKKSDKELDLPRTSSGTCSKIGICNNHMSRSNAFTPPTSEHQKEHLVETVYPYPGEGTSSSYDALTINDRKDRKGKIELHSIRTAIKAEVDDAGRALHLGKSQVNEPKDVGALGLRLESENRKEELPLLPFVKIKSEDKAINIHWEEKYERGEPCPKILNTDNACLTGSFLDVPIGQVINSSEESRAAGSWLSVSQGIAEDTSDLVSGFATIGDGLSESGDLPNDYWDSDEYEDDDDVGYTRQPVEDETWFFTHEIDYPSDIEKGTGHGSVPDTQERERNKDDEYDQSFTEGDSYFSGERYFQSTNVGQIVSSSNPAGLSRTEIYQSKIETEVIRQYNGHLMDEEEVNLICTKPVCQGFLTQTNELNLGNRKALDETRKPGIGMDGNQNGSVRSIGVGMNGDITEIGSDARESLVRDIEYFPNHDARIGGFRPSKHNLNGNTGEQSKNKNNKMKSDNFDKYMIDNDNGANAQPMIHIDGGFSFPPPRGEQLVKLNSSISLGSNKVDAVIDDEGDTCMVANAHMLLPLRSKNSESSLEKSLRDDKHAKAGESVNSNPSSLSNYGFPERERVKKEEYGESAGAREEDPGASFEDEEIAAIQEQVKQVKAQEEEFETFNLKIVHRKNRTGFEEDKSFHVNLNSVIAGRYHVTEFLGSAAFSKAIQAHDLHTGIDVCMKIIKNNKDFFDQSLDEIKLLKYVNKHDPADKYHLLRLYDFFYYREHLLIVCELLKANLYEFQKFNRESGGEVYFTMPRLQSISIQCLEALQFLHSLGLIHCDLKPENILVKSYSKCEVKVIDLGSSCFETDNLCTYVQSRSYRAPEVILGLPYDKRIDIWSLGCILAELCTGNVLFQNDSPATLLARVIGIIGSFEATMLAKGQDTYKYFTKNHMLYERNQETNRVEFLIPKKSSLRHRLPMGDQGFVDFVAHLLEVNPKKRPSASEALKHPWLQYPYEPESP